MKSLKELLESRPIIHVNSGAKIKEVVDYMSEKNVGLVPVLDSDNKLLGVFSERDLMRRVISKGKDLHTTTIDDVMTRSLILAGVNESYEECLKKMKEKGTRHILVIENDKLLGILSVRDLLELDIITKQETIEVLHNYIYST